MKTQLECFRLLEAGEKLTHSVFEREEFIVKGEDDFIINNKNMRINELSFSAPVNWSIWKPPVEKWQVPEGWMYYVKGDGSVATGTPCSLFFHKILGATRPTKEHAERAAKRTIAGNRLEAWLVAHAPDYVLGSGEYWTVARDIYTKDYRPSYRVNPVPTDIKFTSWELCQRACDALNSGELCLEVE